MTMARTFRRAPAAFEGPDALEQMLIWSEHYGTEPRVYIGPDGSMRGSVEIERKRHDSGVAGREENDK